MSRRLRFVVVGAGMAGILAAIRLREAGYDDVTVYEKAQRLGGTWRDNTYPGVACDSALPPLQLLVRPQPGWTHDFSPGAEICGYLEEVARRFDVERTIRFGAEVDPLAFEGGRWRIETTDGADEADVVVAATGVLHHPSYPRHRGARHLRRAVRSQRPLGPRGPPGGRPPRRRWAPAPPPSRSLPPQ